MHRERKNLPGTYRSPLAGPVLSSPAASHRLPRARRTRGAWLSHTGHFMPLCLSPWGRHTTPRFLSYSHRPYPLPCLSSPPLSSASQRAAAGDAATMLPSLPQHVRKIRRDALELSTEPCSARRPMTLIHLQRIYYFWLLHAILSTVLDIIGLYYPLLYYFWD